MAKETKKSSDGSRLKFWGGKDKPKKAVENEDPAAPPRITSDTVAAHREEILAGARRFIYPLSHTRNRVVSISIMIVAVVILLSMLISILMLYRYQSSGTFAYRVTQILPFPIAKVDDSYVNYEDYLFELGYSLYYFNNFSQEGVEIDSPEGEELVRELKSQALDKIIKDALAIQIAEENGITVTDEEIETQIEQIRVNGGIEGSDEAFDEILRSSYNWDIDDLRRSIRVQLIKQALIRSVDSDTTRRSQEALERVADESFGDLAEEYSDDILTNDSGGVIGTISKTDTTLPSEFVDAAFELEKDGVSEIIETRFGLHIIKVTKIEEDEREVAHILFQYDIENYLQQELDKRNVTKYITVK